MSTSSQFRISSVTDVLTPNAPGLDMLVELLRSGSSIMTRQTHEHPVSGKDSSEQFLFCETSGSTGRAKTIRRRPESWIQSFEVNRRTFDLKASDCYATLGHLGHSLTLYATLEAFHVGADLAALTVTQPKKLAGQIGHLGITVLYATPSQLRLLVAGANAANLTNIAAPRRIFSGGGKLDPGLHDALGILFPNAEIREFFGAAETSFVTMTDVDTPTGSVGRAYPGVSIRIEDDGRMGGPQVGEISVRSPFLFDGYEPGTTATPRWKETYFGLGEMGYLDENGNLFLKGRKDRMVTVSDRNVFPEEIEQTIQETTGIQHCAALAILDDKRGHAIICVLEGQMQKNLETTLRRQCRSKIGVHAVPRKFLYIDEMPLLSAGKPDLQKLRQLLGVVQ
jgi:long-chain acyl-CoA synthetase